MIALDLFSGTGSAMQAFNEKGWTIISVDNGAEWHPDMPWGEPTFFQSVEEFALNRPASLVPDFAWASCPCQKFSVASIGKYWNHDHTPKHPDSAEALKLLETTVNLMRDLKVPYWLIENPRGKMRRIFESKWPEIQRYETGFCPYWSARDHERRRQKPTDLFGIMPPGWQPIPPCGRDCELHLKAPRGSTTGTQGMNLMDKGRIPYNLTVSIERAVRAALEKTRHEDD